MGSVYSLSVDRKVLRSAVLFYKSIVSTLFETEQESQALMYFYQIGERVEAEKLLSSVSLGMLLMWDNILKIGDK